MKENKSIRWAILGAGHIANAFAKDFKFMKNAKLVAVASRDRDKATSFAKKYKIPVTLNYDELYKSKEIDAVYIATPHNFHFEQTKKCLQNAKAVLCEKPITVNDNEFKKLAKISQQKNIFLMEAMWTYFLPAIQQAKKWIEEGRIGELKIVQAEFGFAMERKTMGRLYNSQLAGGALLDLGVYPVAVAAFFANAKPKKIVATGLLTDTGVDAQVGMFIDYGNIFAILATSMITRMKNGCTIYGEKGFIEIPNFWRARTCKLYDAQDNLIEKFDDKRKSHGFVYEMQHANDLILKRKIESNVIPHSKSNHIQEILTEVRRQIGLKYPFE